MLLFAITVILVINERILFTYCTVVCPSILETFLAQHMITGFVYEDTGSFQAKLTMDHLVVGWVRLVLSLSLQDYTILFEDLFDRL